MFKRSFTASKDRAGRVTKVAKHSIRDEAKQRLRDHVNSLSALGSPDASPSLGTPSSGGASPQLNSAIVTMIVGKDQRIFAAHEDVLSRSPWLADACRAAFFDAHSGQRRITLPDEIPEVFSILLEFLYRGDYYPRLLHDKKRNQWALEDAGDMSMMSLSPRLDDGISFKKASAVANPAATIYHPGMADFILRDTVIYCMALRFGLPDLQRLALRKQGLQTGIDVATILRSARYSYANTPPSDSRLRAHYLALIIRGRKTFKRSGTMQMEMERGGSQLFFDLFVAMCNHVDDLTEVAKPLSPPLSV